MSQYGQGVRYVYNVYIYLYIIYNGPPVRTVTWLCLLRDVKYIICYSMTKIMNPVVNGPNNVITGKCALLTITINKAGTVMIPKVEQIKNHIK